MSIFDPYSEYAPNYILCFNEIAYPELDTDFEIIKTYSAIANGSQGQYYTYDYEITKFYITITGDFVNSNLIILTNEESSMCRYGYPFIENDRSVYRFVENQLQCTDVCSCFTLTIKNHFNSDKDFHAFCYLGDYRNG